MSRLNELARTNPTGEQIAQYFESLDICQEAVDFARARRNAAQIWEECERGDWLLWILARADGLAIEMAEANEMLIRMYEGAGNPPLNSSEDATDVPEEGEGITDPVVDEDTLQRKMADFVREKWSRPELSLGGR